MPFVDYIKYWKLINLNSSSAWWLPIKKLTDRQTQDQKFYFFIFQTSKLYLVGYTVNNQWFLERVENVNIKHYIKHSSPWQCYGYYFDSANFLANFICRSLSMFKYDKYIINSLIITTYINKTYQHKNKCLLLTARFPKVR